MKSSVMLKRLSLLFVMGLASVLSRTAKAEETDGAPKTGPLPSAAQEHSAPMTAEQKRAEQKKKIESMTPFLLTGIFSKLPELSPEQVVVVEGLDAFRKKVGADNLTVWPIAKFKGSLFPPDEPAFRTALVRNAAKLGAEYVVILTDAEEIQENFKPRFEKLVYCAFAYKHITAVLGIERDSSPEGERVAKVTGFMKESRAEACGLKVGDIIKSVNGIAPADRLRYWNLFMRAKPGDKVKVVVDRDGKTLEFEVELVKA